MELLERSRTLRDLRGPLFPKMGAPPRREHDFRNLYEQEREASYRGVYSFAWDRERAGEGIREDETRSQRKNNNALPDSFLYESLEAREQDGITAGEPESMSA